MSYRQLATRPVLNWALAAVGARLPVAMAPLALVFLVRERPGGYALGAGLAAAYVIGEVTGATVLGPRLNPEARRSRAGRPAAYHGPVRIDLHTHSSASDGTDPPAEVVRRAREAGLDVLALTDHDTVDGHAEALRALPPGLTLVPGMELSCDLNGRSLHLLAYLFDPHHPGLAAETEKIRGDRVRRARVMVAKLAELGADVTWEQVAAIAGGGVVGRPHIARAMVESGVIGQTEQAFTPEWIGEGGRAYEDKYALDPAAAIGLVREAGGVSVLAHPGTAGYEVPDEVIVRLAAVGLAGAEVWHPEQPLAERERAGALAIELGLLATGGSDDHGALTGHRIGCETTPAEAYRRLTAQASGQPLSVG